jgi:hypothetical protein
VGIHWLLRSSCCFLNTNTAIMQQLIGTARMLEAEWWQVCGEAWVQGQRKMSQVLGAFGVLDFTMLQPVLAWRAFWNLWTVYFFNFTNFFSGRGPLRILNPQIWRSTCTHKIVVCECDKGLFGSLRLLHNFWFWVFWFMTVLWVRLLMVRRLWCLYVVGLICPSRILFGLLNSWRWRCYDSSKHQAPLTHWQGIIPRTY